MVRLGTLETRPNLRPFFGPLTREDNEILLDRLLAIDRNLQDLARKASIHVGIAYEPRRLSFSGANGFHGGPSGDAGDIWFDVGRSTGAVRPGWTVESRLIVFCSDRPEPGDETNGHDLVCLTAEAATPAEAIDILESHVARMEVEVLSRPPGVFTSTAHAFLP